MFKDRFEAGEKLAQKLKEEAFPVPREKGLVLGILRGGVVVGSKISQILGLPLDCLVIKKIRAPENEELAIGAVGEGGVVVWQEDLCQKLNVSLEYKQEIVRKKLEEFEKKKGDFREGRPIPDITGKKVFLIDDGVATGATIKAAIAVVRNFRPEEVIVAVPIVSPESLAEIKKLADRVIYLEAPEMFFSVGQSYEDFRQFTDEEILKILNSP